MCDGQSHAPIKSQLQSRFRSNLGLYFRKEGNFVLYELITVVKNYNCNTWRRICAILIYLTPAAGNATNGTANIIPVAHDTIGAITVGEIMCTINSITIHGIIIIIIVIDHHPVQCTQTAIVSLRYTHMMHAEH